MPDPAPYENTSPQPRGARLIVASNRGPVSFRRGDGGELVARRGGGGLVTALGGLAGHHDVTWIAHAMTDGDVKAMATEIQTDGPITTPALAEVSRDGHPYRLRFVGQPDDAYDAYYNAIANPLLWFVQHRLWAFGDQPTITRGTHAAWRAYRKVNDRFAAALVEEAAAWADTPISIDGRLGAAAAGSPTPSILIQDYHL
ncbi:MAG: trehalose-6-phosphate synthase, partial [Thermoleophilia bacterium]|nr:trehalose-6-phosphate synthase [Thermoleophilia bacterium]